MKTKPRSSKQLNSGISIDPAVCGDCGGAVVGLGVILQQPRQSRALMSFLAIRHVLEYGGYVYDLRSVFRLRVNSSLFLGIVFYKNTGAEGQEIDGSTI